MLQAPRASRYEVNVEFGDCDPAQIVYFPNFYRWMDAASRHFFVCCGLPPWHEAERQHGIIGTPLVRNEARFVAPASYGDRLQVDSLLLAWRQRSFVMRHRVHCDGRLLVENDEVRVFARRLPGDGHRIEAVPVPLAWRALIEAYAGTLPVASA